MYTFSIFKMIMSQTNKTWYAQANEAGVSVLLLDAGWEG